MDRETLRQTILSGDDKLRSFPIIWNHMTEDQRNLMTSSRDFWAEDTPVTNAALDRLLIIYQAK